MLLAFQDGDIISIKDVQSTDETWVLKDMDNNIHELQKRYEGDQYITSENVHECINFIEMHEQYPVDVLFLDIDGVLNSSNEDSDIVLETDGRYGPYEPSLVENLNELFANVDVKVVVSSTWRFGETIESMQEILDSIGLKCEVIGLTKDHRESWSVRGNEIRRFIDEHQELLGYRHSYEYKNYLIIDDDSDMLFEQRNNFIRTDNCIGVTRAEVATMIAFYQMCKRDFEAKKDVLKNG